ncbi:MAG TPA: PaaX family transcriptional regulator C-terminal domain-containing protein [Microthrixaceae bacterium]|nr:PaaX family transcriptional regulator C-terminal domain-containing protein [Microthrixaceae bacterium]
MSVTTDPEPTGTGGATGEDEALPTRLMVLGLTHRDGTVHGAELYSVAEECGIGAETVRSCMRRLIGEGLFVREGEGRDAVFHATDAGHALLDVTQQRHLLAYAQDAAGRGWDRRWRLVAFAIPETMRAARDAFRDHLLALGGASLQPGLYVSPHRWLDDLRHEAERLGIADCVSTFTTDDLSLGGQTDPRELASELWQLDVVAERYREFIATYSSVPEHLEAMRRRGERLSERDFLPGVLHLAIRFNACFDLDPLLPPELLPRPWPGREARELLARCRRIGVLTREEKSGPALFRVFDDAIAHLP